ncbi:UNVERIFIED_CONTAM: hypothetical protein Sradi_2029100 [Sesamum radiatum]|uniref:Reverse transcriptase RNase H-like domain-containing protein n=1 Tax=Sesamum radiatum TaxID=300843 RepID=A0AAW2TH68_SESRA
MDDGSHAGISGSQCHYDVPSVLTLPNFSLPFNLTTDASNVAIWCCFVAIGHPIAFYSKKMHSSLQASSTYVCKYAIIEAVEKMRQYLLEHTFRIFTDHKSLKSLLARGLFRHPCCSQFPYGSGV